MLNLVISVAPATLPPTFTPVTSNFPSLAPTVPVYQMYTVAGNGATGTALNSVIASSASILTPYGLFVDSTGSYMYLAEYTGAKARKINLSTNIMTWYAGFGSSSSANNVQATSVAFGALIGVCGTMLGSVLLGDSANYKVKRVDSNGIINNYIGSGVPSSVGTAANGDGGVASAALFGTLRFISSDTSSNIYIADFDSHKVRKVTCTGLIITTLAGTGVSGSSGDSGQATAAKINYPNGSKCTSHCSRH